MWSPPPPLELLDRDISVTPSAFVRFRIDVSDQHNNREAVLSGQCVPRTARHRCIDDYRHGYRVDITYY